MLQDKGLVVVHIYNIQLPIYAKNELLKMHLVAVDSPLLQYEEETGKY